MTEQSKTTAFRIADVYGPYAFGVVSLLTIWFAIVKPELDQRAIDFATQSELIRSQEQIARTLSGTAESMAVTAKSMAVTAEMLEQTAKHLAAAKGAAQGAN